MVKLRGPGLSAAASGSLGDALTFSTSKGRAYVKHKPTPAQPQSGNQVSMRAMMRYLSQQWQNLTAGNQATWADAYPDPSLSLYNAFIKHNLNRWRSLKAPSKEYPTSYVGTPSWILSTSATGSVRHAKIEVMTDHLAQGWGFAIFRHTASPVPCDFEHFVHALLVDAIYTIFTWTDRPLAPGTYYWKFRPFSINGDMDSGSYEKSATIT